MCGKDERCIVCNPFLLQYLISQSPGSILESPAPLLRKNADPAFFQSSFHKGNTQETTVFSIEFQFIFKFVFGAEIVVDVDRDNPFLTEGAYAKGKQRK